MHDRDLAVSLALPAGHPWARGITGLYGRFLDVLVPVLAELGAEVRRGGRRRRAGRKRSPICFEDHLAETLLVDGRKAVGCAQARRSRAVLVHAAILLHPDVRLLSRLFSAEEGRIGRAVGPALRDVPPEELAARLGPAFALALDLELRGGPLPRLTPALASRRKDPRWSPLLR